jgi:hypothetical protein
MKYRIEIERSALAIMVVEADNAEQALSRAFQDVREEDFSQGNLHLNDLDLVEDGLVKE